MVAASPEEFKQLTGKLTKDWLLCFLSSYLDAVSGKIDAVMTTVSKHCETSSSTAPLTSQPSSVLSDLFKKSLDEHEYDSKAEKTIVVYNIDKATDYLRKDENLIHVINSLSTSQELLFWTPS